MAEELHRLLRMGLSGSNDNNDHGILFYLFGKPKTADTEPEHAERLQYYKIWDEMQREGDDNYAVHSVYGNPGLPNLPDSTMALCIGLVVVYMIYIIVSLMFQSKLPEHEVEKQPSGQVILIPDHKFHDNVIPDVIKNLYQEPGEPGEDFEKVPLLADTDDDEEERETGSIQQQIISSNVGVHVGSAFHKYGSQIQNL